VIDSAALYALGIALIFVGVLVIVVAIALFSVSGAGKGKVKGGGAIIIGPVPIIFGTDKKSLKTVLMFSLAITVSLLVALILYYLLFRWKIVDAMRNKYEENMEASEGDTPVFSRFFLLLLAGFVLVVVGIMVVFVATVLPGSGSTSVGAVIFIGPFPIVIGVSPDAAWLVLFSIILAVLSIVVFFVMTRKTRLFGD
jgi:uncharacterized protein (TIGR00304 family)